MIVDIVYNIALLLSLGVVYAAYPFSVEKVSKHLRVIIGLLIGGVGVLIMSRPAVLAQGVVFDGRTILLGVSGMCFGGLSTIIAAILMASYRLFLGGGGVWTGLATIFSSCAIGVLWHLVRYRNYVERQIRSGWEPYLVGLVVHVLMLMSFVFLPHGQRLRIARALALPVLILYPVGFHLLAILLFSQVQRRAVSKRLELSERRFKTIFEQAPLGITVTDSRTGTFRDVNGKFLQILGVEREQLAGRTWMEFTPPDDLVQDEKQMRRMLLGEIESYVMDKRFTRPDGSEVWTDMAVTLLHTTDEAEKQHLCLITDITERKRMEDALRYAGTHDALTDVYNRILFERLLRELDVPSNYPLAVLVGDVNGLKVINDAFGWEEGNRVLIQFADTLRSLSGESGYCARIGGDAFAVLLPHTDEDTAWGMIADLQKQNTMYVRTVEVSISYGVAVNSSPGKPICELVKQAENVMNRNKLSESPSARSKAVHTIITTLHEKNRREELHSRRVSAMATRLAESLGMPAKEISELRTIGLLHDIGKIAIDESILNKEGPLDESEWEAIKRHPETGYRIIGTVGELGELAIYILSHHERIDGKGYPQGLAGEAIPLQSRIIAIVDAYDAMTAAHSYRQAVSNRQAALELKRYSGTQFDAALARLFVEQVLELEWETL